MQESLGEQSLCQCTHTVDLCVFVHLVRQIRAQAVFEGELWPAHTAGGCRLSQVKGDQLYCSCMLLPVTGHGYSSGSSLLSKWAFLLGGFWGLSIVVWDFRISHGPSASAEHKKVQGSGWTVTTVYVKWSWHHHGHIRLSTPCVIPSDHYFPLRCPVEKWIFLGS